MKKLLEIITASIGFTIGAYFSALGFNEAIHYELLIGLIVGYIFCLLLRD